MGRKPCCEKIGLKRGPWAIEEDRKLMNFISNNGIQCWRSVPKLAGLLRCGKSCRLRWMNYLRPDLKRGEFTEAEEDQIIKLHSQFGNSWSKIASNFPGRTDNEIKNHWNTRIKKKLKVLGLDPHTHKPIEDNKGCDHSDANETMQSESSGESAVKDFGLELLHSFPAGSKSSPNSEIENGIDIEMLWENLDAGSTETTQIDTSNTFSVIMDESLSTEILLQQWIDDLDSLLLWEGFTNLEEILL